MNPDQQPNQDETPQTDEPKVETPVGAPMPQEEPIPAPTPSAPSLDGISPSQPFTPTTEENQSAPTAEPANTSPVSPGAPVESPELAAAPMQPTDTLAQPATPPAGDNPGKTLGIVSIVLDFIGFALIGLILGIISRKKSKQAGQSATLGTVGMALGIVFTIIGLGFFLLIILTAIPNLQEKARQQQLQSSSYLIQQ